MKIRVLGCYGGVAPGMYPPCFLIDGKLAVDAGALTSALDLREQEKLRMVLLTHSHFDHIKDIPFLVDNLVGRHNTPFRIVAGKETLKAFEKHIFNNLIWPDFRVLPTPENPVVIFESLDIGSFQDLPPYLVKAVRVNHTPGSVGFIIKRGKKAVGFSGDTGPTDRFWKELNETEELKAVFVETSFPNALKGIAVASKHLTPHMLKEELQKLKRSVDVFVYHLKPAFVSVIKEELMEIRDRRVRVVEQGEVLEI